MENILMKAMHALEEADVETFAECFTEDATFSDYCPSSNGKDNWFCYGAIGIEMFYIHMISDGRYSVWCPKRESETRASFFGIYDGPFVYSMFEIKELSEDGLIRKAVVYPT